jgi:AraC-like DNA-binding protein
MGKAAVTFSVVALERLLAVLPSFGVNAEDVCRAAGVDLAEIRRHKRAPVGVETAVWNEAARQVPERALGLSVAEHCFKIGIHEQTICEYIGRSAPTLRDATMAMSRRHRLETDAFITTIIEQPDDNSSMRVELLFPDAEVSCDRIEYGMVRMLLEARRLITSCYPAPKRVTLRRKSTPHLGEYRRFFGVPVELGAEYDAMILPTTCLYIGLDSADPSLHAELIRIADSELESLAPAEQWPVLLHAVEHLLASGDVSIASVARRMGITVDVVNRLVRGQGKGWLEVVDAVRRPLAERLFLDRSLTIAGVGYKVGFASPASFTRAFRRWTGMTPEEYRRSI